MMDTLNTEVLKKVSAALDEIKATTANLNEKLLSEKNLQEPRGDLREFEDDDGGLFAKRRAIST